jgi:hypothetical protein
MMQRFSCHWARTPEHHTGRSVDFGGILLPFLLERGRVEHLISFARERDFRFGC